MPRKQGVPLMISGSLTMTRPAWSVIILTVPELPEVEAVCRRLRRDAVGAEIAVTRILRPSVPVRSCLALWKNAPPDAPSTPSADAGKTFSST